jgi:peptidoglycan-N-acetylglucosamine deacetylase
MFYLVNIPKFISWFTPNLVWHKKTNEKIVYLTFDDGPHPTITKFVLDTLQEYNAKATFFCIGNNVDKYPNTLNDILEQGHAIGNHTYNHVKGSSTSVKDYIDDIKAASKNINSNLFRPPYGSITKKQISAIKTELPHFSIVMYSVLSGDFDKKNSGENCAKNVIANAKPGSIIVFHDSEKAEQNLQYSLPKVLAYLKQKGFSFGILENEPE